MKKILIIVIFKAFCVMLYSQSSSFEIRTNRYNFFDLYNVYSRIIETNKNETNTYLKFNPRGLEEGISFAPLVLSNFKRNNLGHSVDEFSFIIDAENESGHMRFLVSFNLINDKRNYFRITLSERRIKAVEASAVFIRKNVDAYRIDLPREAPMDRGKESKKKVVKTLFLEKKTIIYINGESYTINKGFKLKLFKDSKLFFTFNPKGIKIKRIGIRSGDREIDDNFSYDSVERGDAHPKRSGYAPIPIDN